MFKSNHTRVAAGAVMAGLAIVSSAAAPAAAMAKTFSDVPETSWEYESVDWASDEGVMNGYGDTGTFGPDDTITREQAAATAYNFAADKALSYDDASYSDVTDADAAYREGIDYVTAAGIMTGYGDDAFGPTDPLTREQAAKVIAKLAGVGDERLADTSTAAFERFEDPESVSEWSRGVMNWALDSHVINGVGGTRLEADRPVTRAEFATMLMNAARSGVLRTSYGYSFVANDTVVDSGTVRRGQAVSFPKEDPTREGYEFLGWGEPVVSSDGTMTYLAQWKRADTGKETDDAGKDADPVVKTSTVTFTDVRDDGVTASNSVKVKRGIEVTIPDVSPTRDGYAFAGWNTKADGTGTAYKGGDKVTVDADVQLFAQWAKRSDSVTVRFNLNGGGGTMGELALRREPGVEGMVEMPRLATSIVPPAKTRFAGWSIASDPTNKVYAPGQMARIDADAAVLVAHWAPDQTQDVPEADPTKVAVTFEANGGTGSMASASIEREASLDGQFEMPACSFAAPAGKRFAGWTIEGDASRKIYQAGQWAATDAGSVTLVAQWADDETPVAKAHVTFDANGGTGSADPVEVDTTTGTHYELPDNADFKRDGYTLTAWCTTPDGTGNLWDIDALGAFATTDTKLYAVWEKVPEGKVALHFDVISGAPEDGFAPRAMPYELVDEIAAIDGQIELPAPAETEVRDAQDTVVARFAGWKVRGDASGRVYQAGQFLKPEGSSVTLAAQYAPVAK